MSDTRFGTRGTPEEEGLGTEPLVVASGIYEPGEGEHADATPNLLPGPRWTTLPAVPPGSPTGTWTLDLWSGVLRRQVDGPEPVRTLRFASLARPGVMALRIEGSADPSTERPALEPPAEDVTTDRAQREDVTWARTRAPGSWIAAAAQSDPVRAHGRVVVERIAHYRAGGGRPPGPDELERHLREVCAIGFDRLLDEHRAAWAARWEDAAITIEGDAEAEIGARLALFHLIATVADRGEAAVGARGLTGRAYRGHVFWDADVFVLPFLAATHPSAARAMLSYRAARLPAAESEAARQGLDGARFPWESADDGTDVAPRTVRGLDGTVIPILTGEHQEHITADIAWAVDHYLAWSGDTGFARGEGRELLVGTARYWASRIHLDPDGTAHIRGVMGPDEYHTPVDDNAFTNLMVRHNLRRAAAAVSGRDPVGLRAEADGWRALAAALIDGLDPVSRRHEQFVGFDQLEPLIITELVDVPIAADVFLGHERIGRTQVIKQADVLMAHHLLPGRLAPGSLRADLDHYLPRTAHGSSLSPAIHASLLARAGEPDRGLELFRVAARLDLDDLTGTTAGGMHLATAGSVWQALAYGFLGIRPDRDGLTLDPELPTAWEAVEVHVRFRGQPVFIRATHDVLHVRPRGTLPVLLDGAVRQAGPAETVFAKRSGRWQEVS